MLAQTCCALTKEDLQISHSPFTPVIIVSRPPAGPRVPFTLPPSSEPLSGSRGFSGRSRNHLEIYILPSLGLFGLRPGKASDEALGKTPPHQHTISSTPIIRWWVDISNLPNYITAVASCVRNQGDYILRDHHKKSSPCRAPCVAMVGMGTTPRVVAAALHHHRR